MRVGDRLGLCAVAADRARVVDDQAQLRPLAGPGEREQVGRLDVEPATAERPAPGSPTARTAPAPHGARTTIAAPPRRGSPPPENAPAGVTRRPPARRRRTGCASRNGPASQPAASSSAVVDPRLGVDDAVLVVDPRRVDGVGLAACRRRSQRIDRLQDRRADPVRAGAADGQLGDAVAERPRWGHHAGQPPPGRMAVKAERVEILLAQHVVEVDAGARHHHARAADPFEQVTEQAQPSRSSTAMWVVEPSRRPAIRARRSAPRSRKRAHELGIVEPGQELGRALALGPLHHRDDLPRRGAGQGSASSSASARAIRMPPAEGGGLVRTSRPR